MTTHTDGSNTCDRCGADVGNGAMDKCAIVTVMEEPGERIRTLHLCTFSGRLPTAAEDSAEAQKCAQRVLTVKATANFVETINGGEGLTFYTSLTERVQENAQPPAEYEPGYSEQVQAAAAAPEEPEPVPHDEKTLPSDAGDPDAKQAGT